MACMNSAANNRRVRIGIALLLTCAACTKAPTVQAPVAAAPQPQAAVAGTVESVEGRATAQRAAAGSAARALTAHAGVWPDDTVVTAEQASVAIRLAHNNALWLLQGGQSRRVDSAAAWRAPRQAAAVALADRPTAPTTASAGRHSEQEAGQAGEAATRPVDASAAAAETAERKRKIAESVKKQGILAIVGGGHKDDLHDVFGNGDIDSGLGTIGDSMNGMAIGGLGVSDGEVRVSTRVMLQPKVLHGKAKPADLHRWSNHAKLLIQKAYLQALKLDLTLAGTVVVEVQLADGRVAGVKLVSKHAPDALSACVTGPLATLQQDGLGPLELRIVVQLAGLR